MAAGLGSLRGDGRTVFGPLGLHENEEEEDDLPTVS